MLTTLIMTDLHTEQCHKERK